MTNTDYFQTFMRMQEILFEDHTARLTKNEREVFKEGFFEFRSVAIQMYRTHEKDFLLFLTKEIPTNIWLKALRKIFQDMGITDALISRSLN